MSISFKAYYTQLCKDPEIFSVCSPSPDLENPILYVNYLSDWYFKPDSDVAFTTWGLFKTKHNVERCLVKGVKAEKTELIRAIQIHGKDLLTKLKKHTQELERRERELAYAKVNLKNLETTLYQNTREM